ncbi:MAG: arginyltransferase [Planctomycetota bacterium]
MLVLHNFITEPHACPYVAERVAKLEYSYAAQMTPQEYEDLLNGGCRKFGMAFFRPVCGVCQACRPLRVAVARFRPDRSQRRAWRDNRHLQVKFGAPRVDELRVALFNLYHQAQCRRKGWPAHESDAEEYALTFLCNPVPAVEISVWEGGLLRGIVLSDVTPHVVSAVYHYYHPDCLKLGLGTFCVLQTIELARRLKRPWVHLGFYVAGCANMAYKARFRPHELMNAEGVWA